MNEAITCTDSTHYGVNAAGTGCITCPAGEHLVSGACTTVQGNYVSAASDITQKECTGTLIPKNDKSNCISNVCPIKDGTGTLNVEGGTCHLKSCGAGYYEHPDKQNHPNKCITVPANLGKYSPASNKSAIDCSPDKPADSDWVMTAGASQSSDCNWDCKSTHTEDTNVCYLTTQVCAIENSSKNKIGTGTQAYTANTQGTYGTCSSATDCETGYVLKNGGCHVPSTNGKYANSQDEETSCPAKPSVATWVTVAGGMTKAQACDFTCPNNKPMKTNSGNTRTCVAPGRGKFFAGGSEQNCWQGQADSATALTQRGGASGWAGDQTGVISAAECKVAGCSAADKVLNTAKTGCVDLTTGHYKKTDHTESSCGTAPGSSTGWLDPQPSDVTSDAECIFGCESGRTASSTKGSGGSCDIDAGHVVTRGPASNDAATKCTGGKVPHTNKKSCVDPKQGHFSKNGVETPCKGTPPATSTGWTSVQPSSVTSDTTCEFDCASSRSPVGTGSNGKCSIPNGHIATGNGAPTQCTNGEVPNPTQSKCVNPKQGYFSKNGVETPCKGSAPGTSTGWIGVQPSTVTSDTTCEFDCASGRTASSTKGSGGTCDIDAGHVATGGPASKNPATLCTGGTVPNTGQDKCVNPATGHYSKSGVETPCTTIEHSTWKANTGALSADSCPFTCNSNYGPNAAGTGCLTCGAGEHLIGGVCTGVQGNYVSAANDITQKECTGSSIPKNDKSDCISNDCSSKIDDGTGTIAIEGGPCQLTGCNAGFYEKVSNSCTEVEVNSGYYSGANNAGTTTCTGLPTQHAGWTNPAGSDESSDCTWACETGYTKNSASKCYSLYHS